MFAFLTPPPQHPLGYAIKILLIITYLEHQKFNILWNYFTNIELIWEDELADRS